ncbi:hypothetical protein GCM10009628_42660 [Paeniglutamicibacter kerguelensis]
MRDLVLVVDPQPGKGLAYQRQYEHQCKADAEALVANLLFHGRLPPGEADKGHVSQTHNNQAKPQYKLGLHVASVRPNPGQRKGIDVPESPR